MDQPLGVESEVDSVLAQIRDKDVPARLQEMEATLLALARYLDNAFFEIREIQRASEK